MIGIMKFRMSTTRYICLSLKIDAKSFSESITPIMIRDNGVIMLPMLLITVCRGAGQRRPIPNITSSTAVDIVGTVRIDFRLNFPPVKSGRITVKNKTL